MRRTVTVSLLAVGILLAPIAAAAAPGFVGASAIAGPIEGTSGSSQDGGNDTLAPGERVAGALGAEGAALDGEVSERSFGVKLAAAETNASTAEVVAERLDLIETRLDELEASNETLAEQYANGSLSYGAYAAQAAMIEVERAGLARQLNASQTATQGLPQDVLDEQGVDAAAIEELRTRASELGGQQVRQLAQSIAGPGVGNGFGPPGNAPGTIPGLGDGGPPGQSEGDGASGPGAGENGDGGTEDDANGTDGDADNGTDGDGDDGTDEDGSSTDGDGSSTDGSDEESDATESGQS